jgi:NAD(P)H dehydrogenase (quinone)
MHAPPKSDIPVIDAKTLESYDAFLFGIPTRYGNFPAQWKAFWDSTGGQWGTGGYWGKYAGIFVSTGTPGGGQESTVIASISTLTHHGSESISSVIFLVFVARGNALRLLPGPNISSCFRY